MKVLNEKYSWKTIDNLKNIFKEKIEEYNSSKEKNITMIVDFILEASIYLWSTDIDIVPLWRVWDNKAWISIRFRLNWKNKEFYFIQDSKIWWSWDWSWSLLWALVNKITWLAKTSKDWKNAFDWRITFQIWEEQQEFRISWLPTIFWYEITFRAFENDLFPLTWLDLSEEHLIVIKRNISKKGWMILISGWTWSWKTTLAYAILDQFDPFESKVITVEDPVEKVLYWVIHVPIDETAPDPEKRFTFDKAGKTLMRQTPDVVFFWEMRDRATITKAIEIAETWHLVLSTTHATDIITTPSRLQTAWADLKKVVSVSRVYISQRLLTRLCPHCKVEQKWISKRLTWLLKSDFIHLWKKVKNLQEEWKLKMYDINPKWCTECRWIWEKWRISVTEVFELDEKFSELASRWAPAAELEKYLFELRRKWNFYNMKDDAIIKYLQWHFTEKELLKIV